MKTCQDIINRRKELWNQYRDIERDTQFVMAAVNYIVDPNNAAVRKEINRYPEYLIEISFVIVDKDKNTIPFFLNEVQQSFLADINKAKDGYAAGSRLHLKFLVLKGRQQGFTSFITAYQLSNAIISKNFSGFTLADSGDNTNTIFEDKAKYIYNQLPDALKPTEKYNNRREFHFEKLNSRWRVNTAGNKEVGRSKTINFFHGSEAAFWDSIDSIMTGLGEALTKDSIQILETTANGLNEFKDLWDGAEKGTNNWEPKFYQWWLTPEYVLKFEDKEREDKFKADVAAGDTEFFLKLKRLREIEGLEWNQLYWYYGKYKDLGEKLDQEYPCTAEEAFLASGRPRFDVNVLMEYLKYCIPGVMGRLERHGDKVTFAKDEKGNLEVWQTPKRNKQYFIGVDVAKGKADGDYSCATVWDADKNLVAMWHGHIDPDALGNPILQNLGDWYNEALIAIEENNHGLTTINAIKVTYSNLYKRTTHDKITDQEKQEIGWWTSNKTKPLMIDNMAKLIRERQMGCKSERMIKECIKYVVGEDGDTNAASGNDDTVTSSAIILLVMDPFITELPDIFGGKSKAEDGQSFVYSSDGTAKHVSEIEDEANRPSKEDEDAAWFRRMGW
ncbi:hypothetical protein ACFQ3J_00345 [Paenibacillus provencensis]|uniref:Phage terminase-like protein, large subunit, contains N-terminal HTH domain n=1 Tax=Paenibacillus provencensis TaxID=441151 RepID=A0ABW3PR74_9BACL|nr:hypothetical protein [Paenibacillus sp. MER 78]MCM3130957.1 hypothetical protein [Paenibacillus sp. MER 78]